MPAFSGDPAEWKRADWKLLQNGFVHLFWQESVLRSAIDDLSALEYRVTVLDASEWRSVSDALVDIANVLDFPDYFGQNLDALRDCLQDVGSFAYGSNESSAGTAIAIAHFDGLAGREPIGVHELLDIFAETGREALLIGHRMLYLIQSDNPDTTFLPVGAIGVRWNPAEWLHATRHPDTP